MYEYCIWGWGVENPLTCAYHKEGGLYHFKVCVCVYFVVLFRDFCELLQAVQRAVSHLLIISISYPARDVLHMSLSC